MNSMAVNEFSVMLQEEEPGITNEIFAMLRALTDIKDTSLLSSKIGDPNGPDWTGWGVWW